MTGPCSEGDGPPVAPDVGHAQVQASPRSSKEGPSREPSVRQRRGQARGNWPGDWDREPVLLRRSGRERGGRVYLSEETLRVAFVAARMDPATRVEDVEVWRTVLGGHKGEAQVLLKIRRREAVTP